MALQLYARTSATTPVVSSYRGHLMLHSTSSTGSSSTLSASVTDTAPNERQLLSAGVPADFFSGKVIAQHTQIGTAGVQVSAAALSVADADLRVRARIYKMTAGGSDVETLIVQMDATASLTTTASNYALSASIPTPSIVSAGERFILRLYVFPFTGGWGSGSPVVTTAYDSGSQATYVSLPVTAACANEDSPLYFRRQTTIGIGDALDLALARGSQATTSADVDSADGGTEIAWTRPKQIGSITVTELTAAAIANTANAATYVSASFTPIANRLYLLAVVHTDTAPETTIPTIATSTGLTFVQISTAAFNTIASNTHRLTLFRAMKSSGLSAGTYTVTLADAGTGCAALLAEVTGVNTSGTDGANATTGASATLADASANPSCTPNVAGRQIDGMFACFGSSLQTAPTAGSGFTGLSNPDYATPAAGLFAEYSATSKASASCTLASSAWAAIPVNLVATSTLVALEWISARLKTGWMADSAIQFAGTVWAAESILSANCALRVKIYRRQPDATESLIYTVTTTELAGQDPGSQSLAGGTVTPTALQPDDRVIVRAYIANVGTMGGATCTLYYDETTPAMAGDSFLRLIGLSELKAEGDPADVVAMPPQGTMTGMGS